jgi:hypothetical protein
MKKTVCKPWTIKTCPLKVGDVLYDQVNDIDVMVTGINHKFTDNEDPDELLVLASDRWLSGQELHDDNWGWIKSYPTRDVISCCEVIQVEDHWISNYFTWERQLPLADLPDIGKAIREFKTAIVNQQKISLVLQLSFTLKDTIRKDWQEPEPEWFDDINIAILRYAKEHEDVEN